MKANRNIGRVIAGCLLACCLSRFTPQTFAIEGLRIFIQDTNAVLAWPSDPSESYIIQYKPTLTATNGWLTLSDYYPADSSTNITFFVDPNPVDFGSTTNGGSGGSGGGGGPMPPGGGSGGGGGSQVSVPGTGFYQVVRDGVHLIGYSNNMVLSGIVTIPVELGNGSGEVTSLSLVEDETPVADSIQTTPVANPRAITFNTALLANGVHNFYGSAAWQNTNGGLWEANSPVISVTVSNEITFENWMPQFGETGDTLLFRATSAHPDTDWQVLVYTGASGTNGYLGYFSGHTYNGDISFYWDYSGTSYTNINSFHFEVVTEYIDPPTPPTYKAKDPWTAGAGWVFAVQHAFNGFQDVETLYEELNGFLGAAQSYWTIRPSPSSGNPFAISFQDTSEAANWTSFKNAIFHAGSRNLVYFGHGSPNGLGYNQNNTNISVTINEIGARLHTIPSGQTNRHAFRFVFLDGCSTAKGQMPEAFGLLHKEDVQGIDYYNTSMRRSAFCGWTDDKSIGFHVGNVINYDHVSFITLIQTYMLLGQGLKTAINSAASAPSITVTTHDFKVFGYWDLHIGTDNQ